VAYTFQALTLNFLKHFSLFAKFPADVMINDALTYVINILPLQCDIQEFMKQIVIFHNNVNGTVKSQRTEYSAFHKIMKKLQLTRTVRQHAAHI
jgi:hypothetical protein